MNPSLPLSLRRKKSHIFCCSNYVYIVLTLVLCSGFLNSFVQCFLPPRLSSTTTTSRIESNSYTTNYHTLNPVKNNPHDVICTTTSIRSSSSSHTISDEESPSTKKRTKNDKQNRKLNVYLFTFPTLYPELQQQQLPQQHQQVKKSNKIQSKQLQLLKQWKYHVLGDGGVYFDQRPKTLDTLNSYIVKRLSSYIERYYQEEQQCIMKKPSLQIECECAVLSTCKRFEILVTIECKDMFDGRDDDDDEEGSDYDMKIKHMNSDDIKSIIATILAEQIIHQRKRLYLRRYLPFTSLPLDRPSRVVMTTANTNTNTTIFNKNRTKNNNHSRRRMQQQSIQKKLLLLEHHIQKEIEVIDGVHDVALRLLTLASGLLDRPIFRPFSSRDAHIMNQMKGSLHGSKRLSTTIGKGKTNNITTNTNDIQNTKYTKILFDSALQAGKASRSSKVVPILDELRLMSNGADGPLELSAKAAESARILAIGPILNSCLDKFKALEATNLITSFREDFRKVSNEMGLDLDDTEKGKKMRQMLHQSTVELRRGNKVDVDAILDKMRKGV